MNPEVIGILATMFVLLSFLMHEPKRIRKVNIIGAALFVVYGLLIGAFSTWFLNATLILIHMMFIHRENKKNKK